MSQVSLFLEGLPGHPLPGDLPHSLRRGRRAGLVLHRHEAPHSPGRPRPALLLPVALDAVEAAVRPVALTAVPHHAPAGRVGEGGGLRDLLAPGGK